MKNIKSILFVLFAIMIGCHSKDAGSQTTNPAETQPAAVTPAPPPAPAYDVVRMADGHEMVRVAAGEFKRGSDVDEPDEKPMKVVTLNEFLIDRYEVSNADWDKCVMAKRCRIIKPKAGFNAPDQPVAGLSWDMARGYCAWAGERLPTEAEWEKAARGKNGLRYPWGDDAPAPDYATFAAKTTSPVTANPKGVSPYGAYNMAGNVAEWVQDWYAKDYYATAPTSNPPSPKRGEYRTIRGGSFMSSSDHIRAAYRVWDRPDYMMPGYGVRCVK